GPARSPPRARAERPGAPRAGALAGTTTRQTRPAAPPAGGPTPFDRSYGSLRQGREEGAELVLDSRGVEAPQPAHLRRHVVQRPLAVDQGDHASREHRPAAVSDQ